MEFTDYSNVPTWQLNQMLNRVELNPNHKRFILDELSSRHDGEDNEDDSYAFARMISKDGHIG
jgi:hypothetical protein